MVNNESGLDRLFRIGLAGVLFVVAIITGWWLLAIVGLIPLVTGFIGFCPLYSIFGLSTAKKSDS